MAKKYKVAFYTAEAVVSECDVRYPYVFRESNMLEDVVEAESKSEALMRVASDYNVYEFVKVERVK